MDFFHFFVWFFHTLIKNEPARPRKDLKYQRAHQTNQPDSATQNNHHQDQSVPFIPSILVGVSHRHSKMHTEACQIAQMFGMCPPPA